MTRTALELELVGAGGEPVDLWRTLVSHGFCSLPPLRLDEDARTLDATLRLDGLRARTVTIAEGRPGSAALTVAGPRPGERELEVVRERIRHMLALDEDLSEFYALAAADPDLGWAAAGAGRMLRSPTVFEDVVKTVCTTNCTWSATERMVGALVEHLGEPAPESGHHAFPTPEAMAAADDDFYRGVARAGYRGAYLRVLATSVAEGTVDLETLARDRDLSDEDARKRLLALPGVGPYAAAQILMLVGRYSHLILDSWSRPKYATLVGRKKTVPDKTIERRFRRYKRYAGLAFWLYVTRDWVPEPA